MVDVEALARRAERTAQRSRVRMACRVGVPIALLAIAPIAGGASLSACACVAAGLFVLAAGLRWRDRVGVESVTAGLVLGAIPLIAAVVLRGCDVDCCTGSISSAGEVLCSLAGAVAGAGVTWHASRASGARLRTWLQAMLIAAATAALGCVGLSMAVLVSTLLAVVAGAAISLIPISVRAG